MYAIVFKNMFREEPSLDFKTELLVHFFKVATRVLMINYVIYLKWFEILFEYLKYFLKYWGIQIR